MSFSVGLNHGVIVVAFTGGPCSGKSTLMAKVKQHYESHGFRVAFSSEVPTELITAGITPWGSWDNPPFDFQANLLRYTLYREEVYCEMLSHSAGGKPTVLLCDRGAKDFGAYVTREEYLQVLESLGLNDQMLRDRYKAVIHLVTAADGAEEFYTLANNEARTEGLEHARTLDIRTLSAWHGHPHHIVIDNRTNFEQKIARALTSLARVLGMREPLEKERKFLVTNFTMGMIPPQAVKVSIEQTYLASPSSDVERRVRMWTVDGATSYFYTEKKPTEEAGVRIENERLITLREYEALLREIAPNTRKLLKDRYCFGEHGRNFELDVYPDIPYVTIEAEVDDMTLEITPPTGFEWVEITGDRKYSNRELARIQK